MMSHRFRISVLLLAALFVADRRADACPFCAQTARSAGPGQSMALADGTVLAAIVGKRLVLGGDASATKTLATYQVLKVAAGDIAPVGKKIELNHPRGAIGDHLQVVLMLGSEDGKLSLIDAYPDPTGKLFEYLTAAKALAKNDYAGKLAFYLGHVESEIPEISEDAQRQFFEIPYETIRDRRKTLPADKLRAWLASDKVAAMKKGLYGLMLGTVADPADEALLRKTLDAVQGNAVAAGGVMAGLCLITGKPQAVLAEVLADARRPAECRQGVVQVVRFLWEQAEAGKKADAVALFRLALQNADAAPAAISELALINEFSLSDEIKAYWSDPNRMTAKGRPAVFFYQRSLPPAEREPFRKWLADHPAALPEK